MNTLLNMPKSFVPPTLEQATNYGSEIGLPESECEKFFFYFTSNGWRVGRNIMRNWHGAISGWKLRWQEARMESKPNGAQIVLFGQEYQRVIKRMETIKNGYESHREMLPDDRAEYLRLKNRRDCLRKTLGIVI